MFDNFHRPLSAQFSAIHFLSEVVNFYDFRKLSLVLILTFSGVTVEIYFSNF